MNAPLSEKKKVEMMIRQYYREIFGAGEMPTGGGDLAICKHMAEIQCLYLIVEFKELWINEAAVAKVAYWQKMLKAVRKFDIETLPASGDKNQ